MAKKNLRADDVIVRITFDVTIEGKKYKEITLDYPEEKDWCLLWRHIHDEDNDSWMAAFVGDNLYEFAIYGEDDSLPWYKNNLWMDGVKCHKEQSNGDTWVRGEEWLSYINTKFSNIKIHTKNGKCETIRIKQW